MPPANSAILLTPPGTAAIAVLRLCGPAVPMFVQAHLSRAPGPGHFAHVQLHDGGRIIDDPVAVLVDAETLDLNLHGGPWIVRAAVDLAAACGFEILSSELPLPEMAVDAGSELEVEMLRYLPLARTDLALRTLLDQPRAWQEWIAGAQSRGQIQKAIDTLLPNRALHWLLHPPAVAIVGIPNAGKSTLANQLFGRARSITADLPGTTRDYISESADIDGLAIRLIDTPGLRATDDPIESQAIAHGEREIAAADLVLLVLDGTRPDNADQRGLLARFPRAIQVWNKSDLMPSVKSSMINTVATTGAGIEALRRAIAAHFECSDLSPGRAYCWTPRQEKILARSRTNPEALNQIVGELSKLPQDVMISDEQKDAQQQR